MATSFRIENTFRGHHVYKSLWTPDVGEELRVQIEEDNIFDEFAVAVFKDGNILAMFHESWQEPAGIFSRKKYSSMTCKIIGQRRLSEIDGKGLVVPSVYIFTGKTKHIDKLIAIFR